MYYLRRSIGRVIVDGIVLVELNCNVNLLLRLWVTDLCILVPSCCGANDARAYIAPVCYNGSNVDICWVWDQ